MEKVQDFRDQMFFGDAAAARRPAPARGPTIKRRVVRAIPATAARASGRAESDRQANEAGGVTD